jgi:Asp-tRNA(Asn)/Glu-tRNA(Gln) amidotransferase A subunit family amidase
VLASARAADKARTAGGRLGLLHGLPIPVKDSVNTVAYPTSNGTRLLEHSGRRLTPRCSGRSSRKALT